ncbi:MAG: RNA methyltransferase [Bacteroidetes bacterium CG2_30_32_10]|nr:MAG: RNA methyltransferase [Bacteroidetes bacterium CG2_30_32_10]
MRKLKNCELNRMDVVDFKSSVKNPIIIVLDNIRSMNNIGSVFRTADAFLIEAIYLCGITATPPNKEIHKTALGATESVSWLYFESTDKAIEALKNDNYAVFAIEQVDESMMLDKFNPSTEKKIAFVFGNEINGVDAEIINNVDGCIEIPQYGTKHSLNIAVSVGIVIWDICFKLHNKG